MLDEPEKADEIQSVKRPLSQEEKMEQPLLGKNNTLTEKKTFFCGQK
jgi:hypothetical protein